MSKHRTSPEQERRSSTSKDVEVLPMQTDDDAKKFEEELAKEPVNEHFVLRLFVTGSTPKSLRAIQNIRIICDQKLKGRYELEVIDLRAHPEHARSEQIFATPTLVKKLPLPVRRLIGDLSDHQSVLAGLDVIERRKSSQKTMNARPDGGHAA